jgi:hypothetical protein
MLEKAQGVPRGKLDSLSPLLPDVKIYDVSPYDPGFIRVA